jgi:uncharacterized protein YcbX
MAIAVCALSVTAVKGTRLRQVDEVDLGSAGAHGNRRYFVVDQRDRMLNAKIVGELQTVLADSDGDTLALTFPDGLVVSGEVSLGEPVTTRFFSRPRAARVLDGPWSAALSEHLGMSVRIVDGGAAVDRGAAGAVSLISRGSLTRLAEAAGESGVDPRRFRMLVEVDGVPAHEEDRWVGRSVRIGGAIVRWAGHVGRCLITSRDPDTGVIDLPTLDILRNYRPTEGCTEPLPFGIYGAVVSGGRVRIGDAVARVD